MCYILEKQEYNEEKQHSTPKNMCRLSLLFLFIFLGGASFAQSTLITPGNGQPSINATTNTNGVLIPRMNTTERNQITNKQQGTTIYNIETNKLEYWDGAQWQTMLTNYNTMACDEYCPPRPIVDKTLGWDYHTGNQGTDVVNAIALITPNNPTSDYYVTGRAWSQSPLGQANIDGYFLAKYTVTPTPWERKVANAVGYDVAVDGNGNVYTTGKFTGTVNFHGTNLVSLGGEDIFLAKYDANGTLIWVRSAGSTSNDLGKAISIDATNNVYLTGYIGGNVSTWGIGNHAGGKDIFIAKYDANGAFGWASRDGGASDDEATDISAIYGIPTITGYYTGTANFNGTNYTSSGGKDVLIAQYNNLGVLQRVITSGGTGDDVANGLNSDGFVTGYFSDILTFPTMPSGTVSVSSAGGKDMFLAHIMEFSGSLKARILVRGGGTKDDEGVKVVLTGGTNSHQTVVAVAGNFSGNADFDGPHLVSNTNSGFVAAFSYHGHYLWGKALSKTSSSYTTDIAITTFSQRPYIVGVYDPYIWYSHPYLPIMKLWTIP